MVISRKDKPSFISANLAYLRQSAGKTMEEMAELLSLKGKSSYGSYEDRRATPDIYKLIKLASYFDVSVEDLVYKDLANTKIGKETSVKKLYEIPIVPISVKAGYAKGFGDIEWLDSLKTIQISTKPYGIARAFEIDGDSMEPLISDKSIVVGIKIARGEIKDNKTYVVVTKDGPQCKNIRKNDKDNTIYLLSKNEKYPPMHIDSTDILEMWEVWMKNNVIN